MLTTFDRYMREFRAKRTQAKYERTDHMDGSEVIHGALLTYVLIQARQAVKNSMRNMEGQ